MLTIKSIHSGCAALMIAALIAQPMAVLAEDSKNEDTKFNTLVHARNLVEIAPKSSHEVALHTLSVENSPLLTHAEKLMLLQKKIKYVFVLFQENRSFDFYFGTYPGANGLFSQSAAQTAGFTQPIVNTDGTVSTLSPFKIPQSVSDVNGKPSTLPRRHRFGQPRPYSHRRQARSECQEVAQNDRYAFVEEGLKGTLSADGTTYTGAAPTLAQKQKGELVVGHVDCDTAPFLWNYADRFTLFDNFFDTVIGPSTPNAIAMFAGQSGETQWVKHPVARPTT